jgi:trimeric autotransporter adhesin
VAAEARAEQRNRHILNFCARRATHCVQACGVRTAEFAVAKMQCPRHDAAMSMQYGRTLSFLLTLTAIASCAGPEATSTADDDSRTPQQGGIPAGADSGGGAPGGDPTSDPVGAPGASDDHGRAEAAGDPAVGRWRHDFALPGVAGFGSRVEAIALGSNGTVYIGGIFSDAAGLPVNNVAQWTGSDWAPLGGGLDGWVRALRFDGNMLWAATTTSETNSGTVQRWDGSAWIRVGLADGPVIDLAIAGNTIAVVGGFTAIDGVAAAGVAYLDASGWHAAGTGSTDSITAIAADGKPGAGFCVAGSFSSIGDVAADNAACWNGTAWSALGNGLPGGVAVLAQRQGLWFAGGTLTFVTDPETGAYQAGIAVLKGATWVPLDGGIDNGYINEVRAIAFSGNDVLIGGCFATAGAGQRQVLTRFLARWSPPSGWFELAGGLTNDVGVFLPSVVGGNDIAVGTDGTLWIGGLFTRADGTPAVNIAHVPPGGAPTALVGDRPVLGVGGFVDGLAVKADGSVVAGGDFAFAGQAPTDGGIAQFRGAGWSDLGHGLQGIVRDIKVRPDGAVAVAGELFFQGMLVAYAQSSATGWVLPGGPVRGRGFALVERAGTMWLGGELVDAGRTVLHNLARLDGETWSAVGDFNDRVTSLVFHDGELIAGGLFGEVNGQPINALARLTTRGWTAIGAGPTGSFVIINALASSPALGLLVGGFFEGSGDVEAPGLMRWDGAAWHDVGGGLSGGFRPFVSALLVHNDGVFVSGGIDGAGGAPVSNIAWYDGTAWHALGDGLSDLGETMVVAGNALYVGGPFTVAGGRTSSGIAAWEFAP